MTGDDDSDATLLGRYRDGDRDAFERFVRRHQDRLFRLACVWLDDATRAEDATQEAFLRALSGFGAFRFRAAPFTWLYRTLRNVCHELNRQRRHEPYDDTVRPAPEPDAGAALDTVRTGRRVRALVSALPARQREVVMLRIFEGCSVNETAALMGCREGTVKALLHKAKVRLKATLDVS